jgi:hypothetical protein
MLTPTATLRKTDALPQLVMLPDGVQPRDE